MSSFCYCSVKKKKERKKNRKKSTVSLVSDFFRCSMTEYLGHLQEYISTMENEDSELGSQSISSSGSEKMIVPKEPSHSHISSLKTSACGASATSDSAYGGSNTTQSQRSGSDKRSHSSKSKSQISSNSSSKYVSARINTGGGAESLKNNVHYNEIINAKHWTEHRKYSNLWGNSCPWMQTW